MLIIDSHVHVVDSGAPLKQMIPQMHRGFRDCGFGGVCFAVNTSEGFHAIHRNLLAFLYKLHYPEEAYIFAGLDYHIPGTDHISWGFGRQAELFREMGADGFKMYEGKPNARKVCGNIPLTSDRYRDFFAHLEENTLPVAIHLGDPPAFWDRSQITADQLAHGWFFGDLTHATWREIYDEVMAVVARHPGLPVIIPQFGYLLPDLERISELLERYPNLYFDIAPARGFYGTGEDTERYRSFFTRYSDRLLYACTGVYGSWESARTKAEGLNAVLAGLDLPADARSNILSGNFRRLCPSRALNREVLGQYAFFLRDKLTGFPATGQMKRQAERAIQVADAITAMIHPD